MALSTPDLIQRVDSGSVSFDPPIERSAIKQVSIDLRLGRVFTVFKKPKHVAAIQISSHDIFKDGELWETHESDSFFLKPRHLVLAQTLERVTLPGDLMGLVEGRSSWARLGVGIHITAPKIDPGYNNYITLELTNHSEVAVELLAKQDQPCQLILFPISTPLGNAEVYGSNPADLFQRQAAKPL